MSDIDTQLMMSITRQKLESLYRTNNLYDLQDRLLAFISYKKPFCSLWRLKFFRFTLHKFYENVCDLLVFFKCALT